MSITQPYLSNFPSYIKPKDNCGRSYYEFSDLEIENSQKIGLEKKLLHMIVCDCGAPRWCHLVYDPEAILKDTNNSKDFIHRYCKLTQKELMKRYSNHFETINELCFLCLKRGICCFFSDHPKDETPSESYVAKPEPVTFKFDLNGSFLSYTYSNNLLKYFNDRYQSNFSSSIFIRNCYQEMYDLLENDFIITGVPGVGKSAFLNYILYRHIQSAHSRERSFVLCLYRDQYRIFNFVSHDEETGTTKYEMSLKNNLEGSPDDIEFSILDFESQDQNEYNVTAKKTWYLSSPNYTRYKTFAKDTDKLYMPTWDLEELRMAFPSSDFNLELYYLVGGVPRNIIFKPNTKRNNFEEFKAFILKTINDAVKEKGGALMSSFNTSLHMQLQDSAMSYKLISINPSRNLETLRLNYTTPIYDFSSEYISSQLYKNYKEKFINLHLEVFKNDVVDFAKLNNISKLFEKAFLYLAPPVQNKQYELTSIMENYEVNFKYFSYSSEIIYFDSNFSNFQINQFYVPINENFESVDAFCLRSEPSGTTNRTKSKFINILYFFQVTTSKRHPVKFNGLDFVKNFYTDEIHQYKLVFVLPKGSHIKEQDIKPISPTTSTDISNPIFDTATQEFINQIVQYKWIFDFDTKLLKKNSPIYFKNPSASLGTKIKRKRSSSKSPLFETAIKSFKKLLI